MDARIEKIVEESRKKSIQGKCIDLVPLSMKDIGNVVQIRNCEKNKYFLNQNYDITEEGQKKWYESYMERKNDIYWCIYNKENEFIGTIRVYDIDGENDICDQGSFMIYEEQSEGAPYALEAEILSLDFAFDILGIHNIINEDRCDNKVMNNLTRRLGFEFKKKTIIRDIEYNYYILTLDNYRKNRKKFAEIIDYWELR